MTTELNGDDIKNILSRMISDIGGFQAYAVTKEKPRLRTLSLTESGPDGGLKRELRDLIREIIKSKFLSTDADYVAAKYIADEQHKFYIIPQDNDYNPFDFLHDTRDKFHKADLINITDFIFELRLENQSVYCFQKGRSVTVPNRKKASILARLVSEEGALDKQTNPIIAFRKTIDALIIDDNIITDNIKLLERNFNFNGFIQKKALEAAQGITESGLIASTSKLEEYLNHGRGKKIYYKKMMRTLDSPVLHMNKEKLINRINTVPQWKGRFKVSEDGKILINTYKEVELLIDLLDERFTKSEITDEEYDTGVKKLVREETQSMP